ncbi:hypothetical protein GCM10010330_34220 [Streptomyces tendae]|nr:hypothetical protein GCM10010330_34220 [Streptomyces tendae]
MLGHSSPAITLGYYAHFMPEARSKGRTATDGLLGKTGSSMPNQTPRFSPRLVPTGPAPEKVRVVAVERMAEGADWLRKF